MEVLVEAIDASRVPNCPRRGRLELVVVGNAIGQKARTQREAGHCSPKAAKVRGHASKDRGPDPISAHAYRPRRLRTARWWLEPNLAACLPSDARYINGKAGSSKRAFALDVCLVCEGENGAKDRERHSHDINYVSARLVGLCPRASREKVKRGAACVSAELAEECQAQAYGTVHTREGEDEGNTDAAVHHPTKKRTWLCGVGVGPK